MSTCAGCDTTRTNEPDYDPFQMFVGSNDPGWYSGDDGELCGPCMVTLFRIANRR